MGSGINNRKKILLISSGTPFSTASKMIMDVKYAFQLKGYDVTFLTKYKDKRFSEQMYGVLDEVQQEKHFNLYIFLVSCLKKIIFAILSILYNLKFNIPHYYFLDKHDDKEIIPTLSLINAVGNEKRFDFILLYATHNMISFENIIKLYDFYKTTILILSPDMYPFTGGCHYFNSCNKFINGCGKCPALLSIRKNDKSFKNAAFKKKVYTTCNIKVLCNTFMLNFAKESSILNEKQLYHSYPIINEKLFKPSENREILRDLYKIPRNSFVLFAGATSIKEKRKGFIYLKRAVNKFVSSLAENERKNIILCIAGKSEVDPTEFSIQVNFVGYLSYEQLADYFALSDIHISTTIEDAGPMMVNQSLSCGVPVVCFNIGTALDVIINKTTGYAADLYDINGLVAGIEYFYKLSKEKYSKISKACRSIALKTTSYSSFVDNIENIVEYIDGN